MRVQISQALCQQLALAASESAPTEACGLLLGSVGAEQIEIEKCVFSTNVTAGDSLREFEVDPILHLRLQKAARMGGKPVIGVWHSHPASAAVPSEADKQQSVEKGWVWLISGREKKVWSLAAFKVDKDNPQLFESVPLDTGF